MTPPMREPRSVTARRAASAATTRRDDTSLWVGAFYNPHIAHETLDAAEIKMIIENRELPPLKSALAAADSGPDDTQKVLKPDTGRKTGFNEGQAAQA